MEDKKHLTKPVSREKFHKLGMDKDITYERYLELFNKKTK